MQKQRKSTNGPRRGSAKLIKEIEKLAAALERNAAQKRGHPFGKLDAPMEATDLSANPEAA